MRVYGAWLKLIRREVCSRGWSQAKQFRDYNDKVKSKNTEVYVSFIFFSSVKRFNSFYLGD